MPTGREFHDCVRVSLCAIHQPSLTKCRVKGAQCKPASAQSSDRRRSNLKPLFYKSISSILQIFFSPSYQWWQLFARPSEWENPGAATRVREPGNPGVRDTEDAKINTKASFVRRPPTEPKPRGCVLLCVVGSRVKWARPTTIIPTSRRKMRHICISVSRVSTSAQPRHGGPFGAFRSRRPAPTFGGAQPGACNYGWSRPGTEFLKIYQL